VKWAGAAYLVFVGVRALVGQPSPITVSRPTGAATSLRAIFASGLTLQLANPKTLIFFVAILPQFVDPRLPIRAQMLWLAAGPVIPNFSLLPGYGYLAPRMAGGAPDPGYARWTARCAGLLVLAAAGLVISVTT